MQNRLTSVGLRGLRERLVPYLAEQGRRTLATGRPLLRALCFEVDDDDNLRSTSDFRAMYCSLLEQWFGFDSARVIPGASLFARPALVKP